METGGEFQCASTRRGFHASKLQKPFMCFTRGQSTYTPRVYQKSTRSKTHYAHFFQK
jgi:hypothetical protein